MDLVASRCIGAISIVSVSHAPHLPIFTNRLDVTLHLVVGCAGEAAVPLSILILSATFAISNVLLSLSLHVFLLLLVSFVVVATVRCI